MIGDPQRVRSSTTTTPLQRSDSVDSLSGESNPLSGHTASQGSRGTSVLSRIKSFFSSLFSMVGKPFAAMARALGEFKARIGEAIEARRQNALRSPGPPPQQTTERTRSPEGTDPPRTQRTDRPPEEQRTRSRSVDGGGRPGLSPERPPPGDDDDDVQDLGGSGSLSGGNGADSLAPRDDVGRDSVSGGNGSDSLAPRGGGDDLFPGVSRMSDAESVGAMRNLALSDGDLAGLSTGGDAPKLEGRKLIGYMGRHLGATTSPAFWATPQAKANVATLGGAMAFSIIDKVKAAGQMTAQDRADFMKALQLLPRDPSLPPLDTLSDDMLDALDPADFDKLLGRMADMLAGVYGGTDSAHPLPGADYFDNARTDNIIPDMPGATRLDMFREIFITAISDEHIAEGGMKPEALKQALEAMG